MFLIEKNIRLRKNFVKSEIIKIVLKCPNQRIFKKNKNTIDVVRP